MPTTLAEIAAYIPPTTPVRDRQDELGLSDNDLRRLTRAFGYDQVAWAPHETEAELLTKALRNLTTLPEVRDRVRYVIRPRTKDTGTPYPDADVQQAAENAGLQHAEVLALGERACATGLFGLDLAGALLAEDGDPDALAVVLVGEKTYGAVASIIPGMAVLGEGVAAMIVSTDGHGDRLLGFATRVVPTPNCALSLDAESQAAFGEAYGPSLTATVMDALDAAGVEMSDVSLYLPHNVSRILCLRTASNLGLSSKQILTDGIGEFGHCWGADPFLNHRLAVESGRLNKGDIYLMTSVGLGAAFSAAVLQH